MGGICDEAISQDGPFEELKPLVDQLNSCPNLDPDFPPIKARDRWAGPADMFYAAPTLPSGEGARHPDKPSSCLGIVISGKKKDGGAQLAVLISALLRRVTRQPLTHHIL
jgi:hypothetical protein